MKKYLKNKKLKVNLIIFFVVMLIIENIGVIAVTLAADQVSYSPSNKNFNVDNSKDALDTLYTLLEKNGTSGVNENSVISFSIKAYRTDTNTGEPTRVYAYDGNKSVSDYISVSSDLITTTVVKDFTAYVVGASLLSQKKHSILANNVVLASFTHDYVNNIYENAVFKLNFKKDDNLTFIVGPGNSTGMNGTLWAFYII